MLEGYAEHVMDAVGADVLDDLPRLRERARQRRRATARGLLRAARELIGMDLKLRQYEQGKAFCDASSSAPASTALNRVWAAPEALPTLAELERPARLAGASAVGCDPQLAAVRPVRAVRAL